MLVVDDAHLLDESSADALVQAVTGRSIALVVTELEGRPLPDGLVKLCRDGFLMHLAVTGLSRSELDAASELVLGGPLALATSELLWRWSLGVPAVLVSILQRGRADGTFKRSGGRWWWAGDPRLLADVALDERTSRGDGDGDEAEIAVALDVVALAEPIDVEMIERIVGIDVLVELERRGLVLAKPAASGAVVACSTPLTGLRRRETMTSLRRRLASRRLLQVATAPESNAELVRVARWHVDGGVPADATLLRSASAVSRLTDPRLSSRIAEMNRRWNGGADALAGLVENHIETGDLAGAIEVLSEIRSMAASADDLRWLARAEYAVTMFGHKDAAAARAAISAARQWGAVDDWELASMEVQTYMLEGRAGMVGRLADRITAAAPSNPRAVLRAGLAGAFAALMAGRTAEAMARADELAPYAAQHAAVMPTMEGVLRAVSSFSSMWSGQFAPAPDADPKIARWPLAGAPTATFQWPLLAGMVAQVRGDHAAAVSFLQDAVVQQRSGKGVFHAEAVAALVVALCDAGSVGEAAAVVGQFPDRHLAVFAGIEPWARGVLACAQGDHRAGIALLRAAAQAAADAGADLIEARYLVELAARGSDVPVAGRLEALARSLDAPVMQAMCREALAIIRGDVAAMTTLSGEMAELGLSGRALAVARRARGIATATGDRGAARQAAATARHLRSPDTPAAGGPVVRAGDGSGIALSRRETEVAGLAGDGLTDREIAARLVLSVRTIESHLASVYRKLGITSRLALAGMFERVA